MKSEKESNSQRGEGRKPLPSSRTLERQRQWGFWALRGWSQVTRIQEASFQAIQLRVGTCASCCTQTSASETGGQCPEAPSWPSHCAGDSAEPRSRGQASVRGDRQCRRRTLLLSPLDSITWVSPGWAKRRPQIVKLLVCSSLPCMLSHMCPALPLPRSKATEHLRRAGNGASARRCQWRPEPPNLRNFTEALNERQGLSETPPEEQRARRKGHPCRHRALPAGRGGAVRDASRVNNKY